MDRGIWATWYDLPEEGREEYLSWLHEVHLPEALSRPGYLWAAHVDVINTEERKKAITRYLTHTDDPSVPAGNGFLLIFGAEDPHVFVDPSPAEVEAQMSAEGREMLGRRIAQRSGIFVEVSRVDGPEAASRPIGTTPGPVIQMGSFNINAPENEEELSTWYARARLPLMAEMPGCIGLRKLVSISGWARHAVIYEFVSLEKVSIGEPNDWTLKVIGNLIHAPGSPSMGPRIWPPA